MYYEEDGDNCDEPNEQWEHVDEWIPPEHVQHDYCCVAAGFLRRGSNTALPTDILWVKYYGKEKYDAIEKCKKAAVARAKTKKTKGEFIYCVCATVHYKKESTWYVYELKNTRCTYMYVLHTHSNIKCSSLKKQFTIFIQTLFLFMYF